MFIIYRNEIIVSHTIESIRTCCAVTEDFLDIDLDWWQVWIWDENSNRWELYGDARCANEVATGYAYANEAKGLEPELEDDLWTVQASIQQYRENGGPQPKRIEELIRSRLRRAGWGARLMRPCPRCGAHWPKIFAGAFAAMHGIFLADGSCQ